MKFNPIILELLARRAVRLVLLVLFFVAALALSYARADDGAKPESIADLRDEVRMLQQQVSWLIAHVQSQKKAIGELTAVVDSQNVLISRLRARNEDVRSEQPPRRIRPFGKTRYGWNSGPAEWAQSTVVAEAPWSASSGASPNARSDP